MAAVLEKICVVCGTDLNGQKRVKDPSGNYFCPTCWKTQSMVLDASPTPAEADPPARSSDTGASGKKAVRVVSSEATPTMGQAFVHDLKKQAVPALFKTFCKSAIFIQFLVVLGLTKKFFPDTNSGLMAILSLTCIVAGVAEAELLARALKFEPLWVEAGFFKSRAGILVMIGFGLAFALAIFLAVA